jgi:hypothetical protein
MMSEDEERRMMGKSRIASRCFPGKISPDMVFSPVGRCHVQ